MMPAASRRMMRMPRDSYRVELAPATLRFDLTASAGPSLMARGFRASYPRDKLSTSAQAGQRPSSGFEGKNRRLWVLEVMDLHGRKNLLSTDPQGRVVA